MFFAAGALALATQVLLLRELLVTLQGDELAIGLGLGTWLVGIAAGAATSRGLPKASARLAAPAFLSALATLGVSGILAARLAPALIGPPPGELITLGPAATIAAWVMFLPGACVGASFAALAEVAGGAGLPPEEGIGRLYVLEALGSLAAGILVTFLFLPRFPPLQVVAVVGGVSVATLLPSAIAGTLGGKRFLVVTTVAFATLAIPSVAGNLEAASQRWRLSTLAPAEAQVRFVDTPYQQIAVIGDGLRHLYVTGRYAGSFPDAEEDELSAHTLATLASKPRRVLWLGGLRVGPIRFLLHHAVHRIDVVEPDRQAMDFLQGLLPHEDRETLADRRVRVVLDDPRRFISKPNERYDLIVVLAPDPVTLSLGRLYTSEFYGACDRLLADSGTVVVRTTLTPNVLTGETAAMAGSIFAALKEVFPVVRPLPGNEGYLVAARRAEGADLRSEVLARRWRERRIVTAVLSPESIPFLFPQERIAALEADLGRATAGLIPSRDDRPVAFAHALALRERLAGGKATMTILRAARTSPRLLLLAAVLPSAFIALWSCFTRGRSARLHAVHGVGVTGACGIVWSLMILFAYQTRLGALYGQIGWLTALFMLGLAAGGVAGYRLSRSSRVAPQARLVLALALAAACAVLLALGLPLTTGSGAVLGGLLLLAGFGTGVVFPVSAATLVAEGDRAGHAAGAVEAADHAGAALGAFGGAVVLVPAIGLETTGWLLVALQVIGCLGALTTLRTRSRV